MRWNNCLILTAFAALLSSSPCVAASFGTVVPIGGHASDIALDESRGVLYIANFTANRIEVMSTADYSIRTSMNVAPQPGALSLSPDSKYLLVAHYGSLTPADPSKNAITLINLNDNTRQTFSTGDTPLGLAFLADGRAFVVTSTAILLFDPISGAMQTLATFAALAKTLPVADRYFPVAGDFGRTVHQSRPHLRLRHRRQRHRAGLLLLRRAQGRAQRLSSWWPLPSRCPASASPPTDPGR